MQVKEKKSCDHILAPYLLNPNTYGQFLWACFFTINLVCTIFVTSYVIAFNLRPLQISKFYSFEMISSFVFLVEIFVNTLTAKVRIDEKIEVRIDESSDEEDD